MRKIIMALIQPLPFWRSYVDGRWRRRHPFIAAARGLLLGI
jgi:hypothetical protein